jgi:predicted dehydrogenase
MTVEEAKAIASAGKASKQVFAAGLQYRSNPIHDHAQSFAKAGVMANLAEGYAQYHKKQSWRRAAPNSDRANEINWRLNKATSSGLMGEIGVHQMDIANWFINALPVSVMGVGSIRNWNDGRDVADTVHCIVEYPKEVRFNYDATLVNSYGGQFEQFLGSDAALILKDLRAWMVKETDAPLLGWEVYARKEPVSDDMGIVLVANATKILAAGADPAKATVDKDKSPLYYAVEDFVTSIKTNRKPNAGPEEGYRATVTALKSNEAVVSGSKITFQKEWFDLA